MKRAGLILFITIICQNTIASQDFYSTEIINKIEIIFQEDNWDTILDGYWSDGKKERLKCKVIINGAEFHDAGVRYKGFSSYKRTFLKKPLNIKLDYVEDQSYQSIKTLKLSNSYKDPTFLREVLSYEIFRKYMPASRTSFVNVTINGINKGLYTAIENIDKTFLSNHYRDENGIFIKGAPKRMGGSLIGKANLKYLGSDSSLYFNSYQLKSEIGWNKLIQLCDVLNNNIEEIENFLNVDQSLWFIALNNVLVNLDSPINVNRNFYLYQNPFGRFNILPWDLNMTFGTYKSISGNTDKVTPSTLQMLDPLFNSDNINYPLVSKILQVPQYRKKYIAHIKTILKENIENDWYFDRAIELQEIIAQYVVNDNNKFYTNEDFWKNLESTIGNEEIYTVGILDLMQARMDYLNSHDLFRSNEPTISEVWITPMIAKPNSDIKISCTTLGAEKIVFAYRSSLADRFIKIPMNRIINPDIDDQQHYELPLTIGAGELQYYIYVENNNASFFSPERSEFQYHIIPVSGNLVINEILASNSSSSTDHEGEFDDYIELYNNSENSISLKNYYLSDKSDNYKKWNFPDIEFLPNDYLIIWADEDSSESQLHANFKLAANGEDLFLSDSRGVLIDKVSFGKQFPDLSYGRFPNGTGQFYTMDPSFSQSNNQPSNSINSPIVTEFVLKQNYPNPFNAATKIEYSIPVDQTGYVGETQVTLIVYDILGREISKLVNGQQAPGNYEIVWNAASGNSWTSSGIYFYKLDVGKFTDIKKMLMIK